MESNQINLFKYWEPSRDTFTSAVNGAGEWGGYEAGVQDWILDNLAKYLTGYRYTNWYLYEVKRGE